MCNPHAVTSVDGEGEGELHQTFALTDHALADLLQVLWAASCPVTSVKRLPVRVIA
jgi:hypothetical protein